MFLSVHRFGFLKSISAHKKQLSGLSVTLFRCWIPSLVLQKSHGSKMSKSRLATFLKPKGRCNIFKNFSFTLVVGSARRACLADRKSGHAFLGHKNSLDRLLVDAAFDLPHRRSLHGDGELRCKLQ